jgi:hypothetical protein
MERNFVNHVMETTLTVLPAKHLPQQVQDAWDAQHGPRELPGRSL